jgi:hypothetical protein
MLAVHLDFETAGLRGEKWVAWRVVRSDATKVGKTVDQLES